MLGLGIVLATIPVDSFATASEPTDGTVSRLQPPLPNFFYERFGADGGSDLSTAILADPAHAVLVESNAYETCPHLRSYNADSLTKVSDEPQDTCDSNVAYTATVNSHSKMPVVAVDPVDELMWFESTVQNEVVALDERTLEVKATLSLPFLSADPSSALSLGEVITGLSWSSPDQLTILSTDEFQQVILTEYDIRSILKESSASPRWRLTVPDCTQTLGSYYGTADAYVSADGAFGFVPCQLRGNVTGVVRVSLASCQVTTAVSATTCPETATPSPQLLNDVIFDPGSDRMLFPNQYSLDVLVYDGAKTPPAFLGTLATGGGVDDASFDFDASTGRLYAVTPQALTLFDVRRTPFAPGNRYASYGGSTSYMSGPVLEPDTAHPYTRFFVAYTDPSDATLLRNYAVFADRVPLTFDPPAAHVDDNTATGATPPGAILSATYGAAASGYGAHLDYVDGPGAAVYNYSGGETPQTNQAPVIGGTRDLLAGWVRHATTDNGSRSAAAVAIGDANDASAHDLQACTNDSSATNCANLPGVPGSGTSSTTPAPPETTQKWPWPTAECSQPGAGEPRMEASGTYATWQRSQVPLTTTAGEPNVDSADSTVDCALNQPAADSASATAVARGYGFAPGDVPTISVASAETADTVSPPTADAGAHSHVRSVATGIGIDLGAVNGVDEKLVIGEVTQDATAVAAGRAGTAAATDVVTVQNVTIVGADGTSQDLCDSICTQQDFDSLNTQFPELLNIRLAPQPDQSFCASGQACPDPAGNLAGSPGGYEATVEANVYERQGDLQFNAMDPSEAVILPAMRIVLFQDAGREINREVVDLAGVYADAHMGLSYSQQPPPLPPTPTNVILEQQAAGYITTTVPGPPTIITRSVGGGNGRGPGGIVGIVEQALSGLNYLVRSPLQVLRMFFVLAVLGLPLFLMIRRRTWLVER